MQIVSHWIDYKIWPQRTFNQHFRVDHEFHGIKLNYISESYIFYPKSNLAIQLLHEGIHFPDIKLNLKSRIHKSFNQIKVDLLVHNPSESESILADVRSHILHQLEYLDRRILNDPTIQYIKAFCKNCAHENKKPFTICAHSCTYEVKRKH